MNDNMNDLITRQLMAETNAEQEDRLLNWREASAENEARYRRRARVWQLLGKVRRPVTREVPDATELIARADVHRLRTPEIPNTRREGCFSRGREPRIRTAAISTLVLVAAGLAAVAFSIFRPSPDGTFGAAEFITGPDEITTVRLDDGTVVRLAPGSRLEFEGRSSRVRQVSFEGLGYFAVAKNPDRPFIIRSEGAEATVLGTRFELRAEKTHMRVVVVEGLVALQALGQRKEVSANQMGRVGANQPPVVVDVEDIDELLSWVDGVFIFQATPLSRVARELGDHYGAKIDIADPELASWKVTAWLQVQSFDAALTAVCGALGAECTIRRDGATLRLPRDSR